MTQSWTWIDNKWLPGNPAILGSMTQSTWLGSLVFDGARRINGFFPDLNLHCDRLISSAIFMGLQSPKSSKEVYDLFPVLKDRLSQRGGTLSGGEQQMLAIGRALMAKPTMLLLDEPSLGIAPKLVNQIFVAIKNINKEKKVTIFLVEQNAKKALELADRGYVLVNGNVTLEGTGQDLLKNKDIQAAYLEGGGKK